jgi:hypothetical protein
MKQPVLFLFLLAGCASPAPPPPVEVVPCPEVEPPPPCQEIAPEQQAVLDEVGEILGAPLVDQGARLRNLVNQHARVAAEGDKLRRDLEVCRRTGEELQARVDQLEADIEELKRLTIEMELKSKTK